MGKRLEILRKQHINL